MIRGRLVRQSGRAFNDVKNGKHAALQNNQLSLNTASLSASKGMGSYSIQEGDT